MAARSASALPAGRAARGPRNAEIEPARSDRGTLLALFVLLVLLVPSAAHLLFSSLGFNPTDDGFVLAYSRRILEGEIPHREFISIRPVLPAALHVPEVWWGGDHAYWISRWIVWVELGAIAFAWSALAIRLRRGRAGLGEGVAYGILAFTLGARDFPIVAWHTIDGLVLLSSGLAWRSAVRGRAGDLGYLLIGAACLCKQSFVPAALGAPLLLGDARRLGAWIPVALPAAAYAGALGATGALPDAAEQLAARGDFYSGAVRPYLTSVPLWGWMLVGAWASRPRGGAGSGRSAGLWLDRLAWGIVLLPLFFFSAGGWAGHASFALFGGALGCALGFAMRRVESGPDRIVWLALLVTWSASISVGYATPALGTGALIAVLLACARERLRASDPLASTRVARNAVVVLVIGAIAGFAHARRDRIYREPPARLLTRDLDGVFPGASGIRTDENTYRFLLDLHRWVERQGGGRFAIVPDLPGFWAESTERNPLPIDWPQWTELGSEALVDRVIGELESQRGDLRVLVQRVEARSLGTGFQALQTDRYVIAAYVTRFWTKTGETAFFEVYE